jgi:glycosyltransferase involved in cell wall biosynthesis
MKILFLTDNFPPEVNAPATRTYEHCMAWKATGAEITIITCAPNFPLGKVYKGYKNKLWQTEKMDGIRVIRVWTYISANKGFLKRTLDYISFALSGFIASLFIKTDVIVATSPQFFTAVAGYLASFFKRKPWVMEVRDLWPESIKAVQVMSSGGRTYRALEKLEMFLYRKASRIVVVTRSFKENIVSRGIPEEKILIIKNGANIDLFHPVEKNQEILSSLNLHNKFIVGYIGTHGMAHKLDFIMECAAEITDDSIHFLLIGDGAEKENIQAKAAELGLKNVSFLDSVAKEKVSDYISVSDIALVPLKKSDTFKKVIPSKLFEVSAMQKPILLGVEGESKQMVEEYHAGLCFEPENKSDFLEKLMILKNDQVLYKSLQTGCKRFAEAHDRKKLAVQMLMILESLTKR